MRTCKYYLLVAAFAALPACGQTNSGWLAIARLSNQLAQVERKLSIVDSNISFETEGVRLEAAAGRINGRQADTKRSEIVRRYEPQRLELRRQAAQLRLQDYETRRLYRLPAADTRPKPAKKK